MPSRRPPWSSPSPPPSFSSLNPETRTLSPLSPLAQTIKTSTSGTLNMLGLAKRVKARLLFTSTSEIYGDPEVHPQVRARARATRGAGRASA